MSKRLRDAGVLLGLMIPAFAVAAKDEAPVDVQVYYSKEDPQWKSAEKEIARVVKAFPRLRVAKISMDTREGYQKLAAAEKKLDIELPGEVTLVLGPYYLTSKGRRRDVERYFLSVVERILKPGDIKGRVGADIKRFALETFGKDVTVEVREPGKKSALTYYRIQRGGRTVGWLADAYRSIRCPVCNDVQFMAAIRAPEGTLADIRPVRPLERWGKTLPAKESHAFLAQFKGRGIKKAKLKVDGISGATKTVRAYQTAIVEVLEAVEKLEKKKSE